MNSIYIRIVSFFLLFVSTLTAFSQNETRERLITNRRVLAFDENKNPTIRNESQPYFDLYNPAYISYPYPVPNSICGEDGKILMYTDGMNVYNKNKEVMVNGKLRDYGLNFLNKTSVFVPIEENNRRYYYLIEATPYIQNFVPIRLFLTQDYCRLEYSIIDTKGNNGLGVVLKKNILIQDSIAPTVTSVKHANNIDTWLVVHGCYTANFYSYKINSCSITLEDNAIIEDYFMYNLIGYSSYINMCNLSLSTKGDYLSITGYHKNNLSPSKQYLYVMPFNNTTGQLNTIAVDTIPHLRFQPGNHLFSQDSRYIYSSGNIDSHSGSQIYFYVTDLTTKSATRYDLRKDSSANNQMIDYGFNNDIVTIYNYNNNNESINTFHLGKLNDIDQFNTLPFQKDTLLYTYENEYSADDFGYLYVPFRNNHINSFYHPSYQRPPATPIYTPTLSNIPYFSCYRDSVFVDVSLPNAADSLIWKLKSSEGASQTFYGSQFAEKLLPGEYTLSLSAYNYCIPEEDSIRFRIEADPFIKIENDTSFRCESDKLTFPSVQANSDYHWENEKQERLITIQQEGYYIAKTTNSCGTASDTLTVVNTTIEIPNLLTPNGDEKNEVWQLSASNPNAKFKLSLYNKWGAEVYENGDYKNDWSPINLSDGIYYYLITYEGSCSKKGWIQVLR